MISALLLAAAAGNFVPPSITRDNERQIRQSSTAGQPAVAAIDARVDPKGDVSDCKTLATSGDAEIARSICDNLKNMRVQPASVSGSSSYGILRNVLSLGAGDRNLVDPADMELQVNKLPAGQASLRVVANVLIDPAGKPQACYAANDAPQAYADVACTQISGLMFGVLKDDAGKPVQYVRSAIIDFELASASDKAPKSGG